MVFGVQETTAYQLTKKTHFTLAFLVINQICSWNFTFELIFSHYADAFTYRL